ncbi:MAG TPA: metallophosphoesterase, partial [Bryobacteraceae bacterium]|nr:metallophosphoesterase [Bryobacteraceae bacterium]
MANDSLDGMQPEPPSANLEPEVGADAARAAGDRQLPGGEENSPPIPPPPIPPVVDVYDLDWEHIVASLRPGGLRARIRTTVEQLEALLDSEGDAQRMLFDDQRHGPSDRALKVATLSDDPLWFIGDILGDLLALNAALALIDRESKRENVRLAPRIVLLGDLFDDGGYGLETVLQVFELILKRPQSVCLLAGNHDEALGYNGARFTA